MAFSANVRQMGQGRPFGNVLFRVEAAGGVDDVAGGLNVRLHF